jgi:hypothetical protein
VGAALQGYRESKPLRGQQGVLPLDSIYHLIGIGISTVDGFRKKHGLTILIDTFYVSSF